MAKESEDPGSGCGVILLGLAMVPVDYVFSGWALFSLWTWFMVPLGAVSFGFWHAVGLSILISFAKSRAPANERTVKDALNYQYAWCFACMVSVAMGKIVHLLMGVRFYG